MGWHYYLNDTGKVIKRLRASNKRRFKRRLKRVREAYANGEMDLDTILRSLANYNGHLERGDTWHLRQRVFGNLAFSRDLAEVRLRSSFGHVTKNRTH